MISRETDRFHPNQLLDFLRRRQGILCKRDGASVLPSAEEVKDLLLLRSNIWPTALLQDIALTLEMLHSSVPVIRRTSTAARMSHVADQFKNPPARREMLNYVTEIDSATCVALGDNCRVNLYGQPILPKSTIPVVHPLDPSGWNSDMSMQKLNLVGGLVRAFDDLQIVDSFDNLREAEATYMTDVMGRMKRMASTIQGR